MATNSLALFSLGTGLYFPSACVWVGCDCFQQQSKEGLILGEFPGLVRESHPGPSPWFSWDACSGGS